MLGQTMVWQSFQRMLENFIAYVIVVGTNRKLLPLVLKNLGSHVNLSLIFPPHFACVATPQSKDGLDVLIMLGLHNFNCLHVHFADAFTH